MDSLKVRQVPLVDLTLDPQNVRTHDEANLVAIKNSLEAFGQRKPIVCARGNDGRLIVIAGNGTVTAAQELGWTSIGVAEVPTDWDADKARAYAIADNRSAELADWNRIELASALIDLEAVGWDSNVLGFDSANLEDFLTSEATDRERQEKAAEDAEAKEEDSPVDRGSLLNLADLGWHEPTTETHHGDHWTLGHHHLFIVDVHREHDRYTPFLTEGVMFAPYPNPHLPSSKTARETPLVMVQPRPILAAFLIDKFRTVLPNEPVKKVTA